MSVERGPLALILGCAGPHLLLPEKRLFEEIRPFGFILFKRNCETPEQIKRLVAELRAAAGNPHAPVLIDQEGGRVQRLQPPRWRAAPPAAAFGALYVVDPETACAAYRLNTRLIGEELIELGINVDCLPLLDLRISGAHEVIGDRAFGSDPAMIAALGRAGAEGLRDAGVLAIMKHIPGHGRALVDSHERLPVVETDRETLRAMDFAPFKALAQEPYWGMTAHVVYKSFDPDRAATISEIMIDVVIRGEIGFGGLLMTDDLGMRALGGTLAERAEASYRAGCDVVLHCSGVLEESQLLARVARPLSARALASAERARATLPPRQPLDRKAARVELERLMSGRAA